MMAPGTAYPRRSFIDLTQDSDEDEDVDTQKAADQARKLLAAFTKPKYGESRPLKRKTPSDEAEVRAPRAAPAAPQEIASRHEATTKKVPAANGIHRTVENDDISVVASRRPETGSSNGIHRTVKNNVSVVANRRPETGSSSTSEKSVKRETSGPATPKPFAAVSAPRLTTHLQPELPSSRVPNLDSLSTTSQTKRHVPMVKLVDPQSFSSLFQGLAQTERPVPARKTGQPQSQLPSSHHSNSHHSNATLLDMSSQSSAKRPVPIVEITHLNPHLPSSPVTNTSSSNISSRSSSERPVTTSQRPSGSVKASSPSTSRSTKETPPPHTPPLSITAAIKNTPKIMVVVPPPASPQVGAKRSLGKRRINRIPCSDTSDEESDPDAPKGIKEKYYPLEMHKVQAEKGRYPKARSVDTNSIILPTRPGPFHSPAVKGRPRPRHSQKLYLRDLLDKKLRRIQGPPVKMALDWDGSGSLASNFEFIDTYKLQQGVSRVPDEFNFGCNCNFQCDPGHCTCLSKEEDSEELIVAYEQRNGKLLLKETFMNRKAMIYECSQLCPCPSTCWNRLVQHGRKIHLEIFHTGNRGFGLRSLDFVHKGEFIDTYLGEVITSAEAELREDATIASNGAHSSPSYLFSLDWFPPSDDSDEDGDDDDDDDNKESGSSKSHYVIDGQRFGGPSRFMNHSCNPNCKMIPVSTHHSDQKIYDLAFFARRDIPPGVELTFDYNPGWTPEMNSDDPNAVKCLCGEAQCRGQLWPNQRKSTNV